MEPDEKTLKDMCCHTVAVRERIKRDVQDIIKHQPCRLGLCEERMYHFLNMFTDELLRDDPHSDGSLTCEQGFSFLKDIKFFAKDSASETVVFSANYAYEGVRHFDRYPVFGKIHLEYEKKREAKRMQCENDSLWTEIQLYRYMNSIVLRGATPHLITFVTAFNCKPFSVAERFFGESNLRPLNDSPSDFKKREDKSVNVLISEGSIYPTVELLRHLKTNKSDLPQIWFQIIWTLAVFHELGFEHHDMHFGNIMITALPEERTFSYRLSATQAYSFKTRFFVRVFDFDHSTKWKTKHDSLQIGNPYICELGEQISGYYFAELGSRPHPHWDLIKFIFFSKERLSKAWKELFPPSITKNNEFSVMSRHGMQPGQHRTTLDKYGNPTSGLYEEIFKMPAYQNVFTDIIECIARNIPMTKPDPMTESWTMPSFLAQGPQGPDLVTTMLDEDQHAGQKRGRPSQPWEQLKNSLKFSRVFA